MFSDIDALLLYAGIHQKFFGYYRALSKQFPYAIYYRLNGDIVQVWRVGLPTKAIPYFKRVARSVVATRWMILVRFRGHGGSGVTASWANPTYAPMLLQRDA